MLETYRGIPHLLDTWIVLSGMALPVALSSLRRPGAMPPRLAAFGMPAAFALVLAATLSPTPHRIGSVLGQCGTHLATTGGLTSVQGLLNVLLFVPAAALLALASGRPGDGIAAGIGLSASVEAVQALIPQLGRSCQLHDLIANTAGAFCGVGVVAGVQSIARRHRLVTSPYVVEHAAMLVVRPRPPARHRRHEHSALRPVPAQAVAKPANRLRPMVRTR